MIRWTKKYYLWFKVNLVTFFILFAFMFNKFNVFWYNIDTCKIYTISILEIILLTITSTLQYIFGLTLSLPCSPLLHNYLYNYIFVIISRYLYRVLPIFHTLRIRALFYSLFVFFRPYYIVFFFKVPIQRLSLAIHFFPGA